MKLSELLQRYGDDRVRFQPLDGAITSINYSAKNFTKITFGTDVMIDGLQGTKEMGIVIWLDRKEVADLLAADRASKEPKT